MKERLFSVMVFILVLSMTFSTAFAQGSDEDDLFPVEIINRTEQPVNLVLMGTEGGQSYSLNVPAGTNQTFTLREGMYNHTTFACGESAAGTLDLSRRLRLVFTPCAGAAPNSGAPSLEKVHLTDAPEGKAWLYQYGGHIAARFAAGDDGFAAGDCEVTTTAETTIYQRPSTSADVFSTVGSGFNLQIGARTSDGWLGFDPGIAQAANIGSFRLRWLPPGTGTQSGGCGALPVVWGPPPGICFFMPMGNVNVYADPDVSSPVEVVLHVGEFAEVLGITADGDWAQVDLRPGNTSLNIDGWVDAGTLNVNGPCSGLPTVSP
jgi:hypothetical protein